VNRNGYTDDTIAKRAQTNKPENGFQFCVTNKRSLRTKDRKDREDGRKHSCTMESQKDSKRLDTDRHNIKHYLDLGSWKL